MQLSIPFILSPRVWISQWPEIRTASGRSHLAHSQQKTVAPIPDRWANWRNGATAPGLGAKSWNLRSLWVGLEWSPRLAVAARHAIFAGVRLLQLSLVLGLVLLPMFVAGAQAHDARDPSRRRSCPTLRIPACSHRLRSRPMAPVFRGRSVRRSHRPLLRTFEGHAAAVVPAHVEPDASSSLTL
jgi:hypothetical protein